MADSTDIGRNPLERRAQSKEPWNLLTDPKDRANAIDQIVKEIDDDQCTWQEMTLSHLRMYRSFAMLGLGPFSYSHLDGGLGAPLSLNVLRSMVNFVHAKLTKDRPRATFQTYGATYKQKRKAKLLQRYAEGLAYQEKLYEKMRMVALDMLVMGTGVLKVCEADGRIVFDHVFSPNLRVDSVEGMYGKPANTYEVVYISRGKLMRMFPKMKEEIASLRTVSETDGFSTLSMIPERRDTDMLRVVEAYHLASKEGARDGLMTISCQDVEIHSAVWSHAWHPYCIARWSQANLGFYGMGLAEELKGIQVEINRLVRKIQLAFQLLGNPYVLADRASSIARGQLTDIPGSVILYNSKEPKISAPMTVHPEIFAHLDRLYQRAYEIAGVSQNSAMAKPAYAFESGRAQLIQNDTEDSRFASVFLNWEQAHMDAIEKAIAIARTIPGYTVKVFGDDSLEEIDFNRDIKLESSEYVMRVLPRAFVSGTPAEQLDQAERLVKTGLVGSPEEALEQTEAPDIQALVKRKTAPKAFVEKLLQSMADGGPQRAPEPQMNIALAHSTALEFYNEMQESGYPPAACRKIRNFIVACTRLERIGAQGGAPAMGAAPPIQPISPTGEGAATSPGMPNPMAA